MSLPPLSLGAEAAALRPLRWAEQFLPMPQLLLPVKLTAYQETPQVSFWLLEGREQKK